MKSQKEMEEEILAILREQGTLADVAVMRGIMDLAKEMDKLVDSISDLQDRMDSLERTTNIDGRLLD